MNDQNSSHHSNNSLENILKELEERFGAEQDSEDKNSNSKKSKAVNFKHFTQSQIIGGLTLVLLAVGAAVGVYLGQTNQELRQRASVTYPQCSNTTGACDGVAAGGRCIGLAGTCQNSETNANCTCIADPTNTPGPTETCTPTGFCVGGSNTCCNGEVPVFNPTMCNANSRTWCPPAATATGIPKSPTPLPTLPPNCSCTQNGQGSCGAAGGCAEGSRHIFITCTPANCGPSEACVPDATCNTNPTSVPPTSVPPTNVPPTGVPPTATRTPTRTPTTVPVTTSPAPTCNGIMITYGTTTEPTRPIRIGDIITLTCGAIAGANHYEFRIGLDANNIQNIAAISAGSRVSQPFTIAQSGTYGAQCRMCTDSTSTSCQPWETP